MPSFSLHPSLISALLPLPGYCLLRCSAAEEKTESGALYIPETIAKAHEEAKQLRKGTIIRANHRPDKYIKTQWLWSEITQLKPGVVVFYQGHADEMDNEYVIVRHGQLYGILL